MVYNIKYNIIHYRDCLLQWQLNTISISTLSVTLL